MIITSRSKLVGAVSAVAGPYKMMEHCELDIDAPAEIGPSRPVPVSFVNQSFAVVTSNVPKQDWAADAFELMRN